MTDNVSSKNKSKNKFFKYFINKSHNYSSEFDPQWMTLKLKAL